MNGKGDKNRTKDYKKFNSNYDNIDWNRKVSKTFKTSWGAEYTLHLKDTPEKEDRTPTIKDMIKS
jgi:hypothetical protein